MNSRARGVSVRFFSVLSPIGIGEFGSATGNALSARFRQATFSMKPGRTVRKRPVARSSFCILVDTLATVGRGGSCPFARKVSAITDPKKLSNGRSAHGSLRRSASVSLRRRVKGFFAEVTIEKRRRRAHLQQVRRAIDRSSGKSQIRCFVH